MNFKIIVKRVSNNVNTSGINLKAAKVHCSEKNNSIEKQQQEYMMESTFEGLIFSLRYCYQPEVQPQDISQNYNLIPGSILL